MSAASASAVIGALLVVGFGSEEQGACSLLNVSPQVCMWGGGRMGRAAPHAAASPGAECQKCAALGGSWERDCCLSCITWAALCSLCKLRWQLVCAVVTEGAGRKTQLPGAGLGACVWCNLYAVALGAVFFRNFCSAGSLSNKGELVK